MSCMRCICEHCANNPNCFGHCQGEMDEPCFNCDDWTGDVEGRVPQVQDNRVLGSASPKENENSLEFNKGR